MAIEKKDKLVGFMLTETEKKLLIKTADKAGQRLSSYVREAVLARVKKDSSGKKKHTIRMMKDEVQ